MKLDIEEDRYPGYDIVVKQRGRGRWKWAICRTGGEAVICGSECSRAGARYKAGQALFMLLCASASRAMSTGDGSATNSG